MFLLDRNVRIRNTLNFSSVIAILFVELLKHSPEYLAGKNCELLDYMILQLKIIFMKNLSSINSYFHFSIYTIVSNDSKFL